MDTRRSIERRPAPPEIEDTALGSLTPEDRERLSMDSWEPSLLRELLTAQNKLHQQNND
jgi:hypothetical protein